MKADQQSVCIVNRILSATSERVFVEMSSRFVHDFEEAFAAQGIQLKWQDIDIAQQPSDLMEFERLEAVLQGLARAVNTSFNPRGESVTPLLEKVLARLEELGA